MSNFPGWAKLNLGLKVGGKRPDGYHSIISVMQTVSLADQVKLELKKDGISLEVTGAKLPTDDQNLAVQAARLIQSRFQVSEGVHIRLIKNIPLAAGLAGGSADAAAVLYGVNELWNLGLGIKDLTQLAAEIGSDVPFALCGGTGLAQGRGEIVSPLPSLPDCYLVLACPPVAVSTPWAYNELDRSSVKPQLVNIDKLIAALKEKDLDEIAAAMANSFEPVVVAHFPIIRDIKQALLDSGAIAALMSGSGPTVYGIFTSLNKAKHAVSTLNTDIITHVAKPVPVGAGRLPKE
ncbi:MAG TPA: 4-(cytidine 5'-diphospho)-2-C-methyl-D-erythritol kinase [Firmicutes bacterium]|nr:4-(cytidine 5'-diphospho)-2-C-methyl-D-erythritol kinase [Bacillota bacterium]